MRTRLFFGALLPVCAAATGGGPAASPASHEISIRLDPSTLAVEITDRVPGGGDLLLAPAGWVDRAEVRVGSRVVRLTSGGNAIALTADELAGEAAIVTVFGTLPDITDERGLAGGGSDGAFLLSGEGWLPVSGKNDALFEITVATPPDWRGVATGALEAERLEEGGYSARFRYEGQAEELAILFGPYEISERMHGDMRLRTYFRAEDAEHSEAYLAAIADHIDRFSEAIGAYPYDGFSVVSAPLPVGYGLPTMTYVSRRI